MRAVALTPTTITAPGSPNAKGSYSQITASLPFDARELRWWLVQLTGGNAGGDYLSDLAIGAGGSEQIILADFQFGLGSVQGAGGPWILPLTIPAGSRLAARTACDVASRSYKLYAYVTNVALVRSVSGFVTYGANAGASNGVQVTQNTVAGSKGSYAQLTAATSRDLRYLMVTMSNDGWGNNTPNAEITADLAVGASGSEQIVWPDVPVFEESGRAVYGGTNVHGWPVEIPSGTRIAARIASTSTDTGHGYLEMVAHAGL